MDEGTEGLGASAEADRATDAPHGVAEASPPSGSVSTGAGALQERLDQNFIDGTLARAVDVLASEASDPVAQSCLFEAAARLRWAAEEMARRDRNETRNCLNWGPCTRHDGTMRELPAELFPESLPERGFALIRSMAAAKSRSKNKYPKGVFGHEARAHYDEAAELAKFSPAPERTQAEVVAKLREAAALARQSDPAALTQGGQG